MVKERESMTGSERHLWIRSEEVCVSSNMESQNHKTVEIKWSGQFISHDDCLWGRHVWIVCGLIFLKLLRIFMLRATQYLCSCMKVLVMTHAYYSCFLWIHLQNWFFGLPLEHKITGAAPVFPSQLQPRAQSCYACMAVFIPIQSNFWALKLCYTKWTR